jgi:hypothetical protein
LRHPITHFIPYLLRAFFSLPNKWSAQAPADLTGVLNPT